MGIRHGLPLHGVAFLAAASRFGHWLVPLHHRCGHRAVLVRPGRLHRVHHRLQHLVQPDVAPGEPLAFLASKAPFDISPTANMAVAVLVLLFQASVIWVVGQSLFKGKEIA